MKRRMISKNALLSAAGLALALSNNVAAADWPEFRGSNAQGYSEATNLPLTWSATAGLAWKAAVAGVGWSSPVVIGERIYLTSALPVGGVEDPKADRSLHALALDAATG